MGRYQENTITDIRSLAEALSELEWEACGRRVHDNKYIADRLGITVQELNSSISFVQNFAKVLTTVCDAVDITHEKEYVDHFIG